MTKDRAGTFIPNLSGDSTYYSFKPNPLPPEPLIQRLCDLDILENISKQQCSKVFAYRDYFNILNDGVELLSHK